MTVFTVTHTQTKAADNSITHIAAIPYITPDEAFTLLQTALERMLKLLDTLEPQDWARPTACTEWDVRAMVAHQAGGYASGTGYREMIRQYSTIPRKGQLPEDAVNALQLRERANRTPQELIAELRRAGPAAARNWAYGFRLAGMVRIPHPVLNPLPLKHLFQVIHSRDTWMHRLDICRATGRHFEQTVEHDGRIAALVMLDVAKCLRSFVDKRALRFDLTGIAGGTFLAGEGDPAAVIQMDVLDFNYFASGRLTLAQALPLMTISGERGFAESALKKLLVLY